MSQTMESPLVTDTPPGDQEHYFRKTDLDRNLFDGAAITALCGFVKEGLAHIAPGLPLCFECDRLMETVVGTGPGAQS